MARGTTLEALVNNLRAEIGQSTNTAVSRASLDSLTQTLRRQQARLWTDYDWPFLRVERDIQMQAGGRYYDFPVDLDLTRIEKAEIKWGGIWQPVAYGISSEDFVLHDSDLGIRNNPVMRWDYYNGALNTPVNQFEVWPIPANNGTPASKELHLRFTGIRKLRSLVAMSDTADLDDDLLVLYSAAEILARLKTPDASSKLENANLHYNKLKARGAGQSKPFVIGGCYDEPKGRRGVGELRVAYADQDGNIFS